MSATAPAPTAPVGKYRWVICALLFFCSTINYVDRQALSVLKTTLQDALGWTDVDYGWITFAFTVAYAAFPSLIGRVIDRYGVKTSLAAALILWSAMAAAHGLVSTVFGFVLVRFFLGLAEAANFPASIKAVAMWFPQKERALATGIFNSGTNIGVLISVVVVWIAETINWQSSFVAIGLIGVIWLFFWRKAFFPPEDHPRLKPAELAYIQEGRVSAGPTVKLPWTALLRYREIWPFLLGKMLTDPVWWFYLFWLPSYLSRERGQNPLESAGLLGVIYTGATVGSIAGGWLSGHLIARGWSVGKARLTTMLIAAVCMPGAIIAYYTQSMTLCIALIMLATAAHQAWSANIFTSATDLFPAKVSGSVVGLGATTGGIGGMFMTLLAAPAIQWTGNQELIFLLAGIMHLISLAIFWVILRGHFNRVDTDVPLDLTQAHKPLIVTGIVVMCVGAAVLAGISLNWDVWIAAVQSSGAIQACTAAAGFCLIGVALAYAGAPKNR
ncbi:MAG TPA: MFS transporter [Steroidobacteraceae bacterium]|nr:MFS transporter [Steroidobacteraceae bacterium]